MKDLFLPKPTCVTIFQLIQSVLKQDSEFKIRFKNNTKQFKFIPYDSLEHLCFHQLQTPNKELCFHHLHNLRTFADCQDLL